MYEVIPDSWAVIEGECVEKMRELPENSVDAVVTDPPYALPGGFMGKTWDRIEGREDVGFGYYLAGLADGEGHFRVQRHERGSHTCAFTVHLRRDDMAILQKAQRFTSVGTVTETTNGRTPMARWVVQDKEGCAVIVGLFRRFPLRAKKALDFGAWADAVDEWLGRPRGNRWHGPANQSDAARHKACIERMREYADPPWSGHRFQDWTRVWAMEAMRVLKPGGHVLVMGGTRTYHRMTAGLEDAGFEVRDCLAYLYGSGFPKSKNLGNGWGTALKPAHEPIVLARKPLSEKNVAANVQRWGTGVLNIDGTRIEGAGAEAGRTRHGGGSSQAVPDYERYGDRVAPMPAGRWPPNVVVDEEAARMVDEQSGELHSQDPATRRGRRKAGRMFQDPEGSDTGARYGDVGGASRFFKVVEADAAGAGTQGDSWVESPADRREREGPAPTGYRFRYVAKADRAERNIGLDKPSNHPTVKPVALMEWLCKMVTPPGGLVLDPFVGSGSTGIAALRAGFRFLGIEKEPEYVEIARARIQGDSPLFNMEEGKTR